MTRQELWYYIVTQFGVSLPHKVFTPGHSSPFAFVADAFFHPGKDVAAWANRSGIKTLGASILAALEFRFTQGLQGRVLAGSEAQAKFLYAYWQEWCGGLLADCLNGSVTQHLTRVNGGKFSILAASQKQVRGPKVHRLYEDELDEIPPDIDRSAAGMIASRGGIPGRTVYTSTWQYANGPMAKLVESCPENGVTLHKWNLWESLEQCPQERHDGGKNCEDCPLGPVCLAKAREYHLDPEWPVGIAAETCGLYTIDDAIKSYRKVGTLMWDAEYECKRPSIEGLVYPMFDADTHRCDTPPADLKIYRAIDWGLNVFVCLWIGLDKNGTAYLLDTYRSERATIPQHAKYILAHKLKDARATYCDPAGRNQNDQTGKSDVQVFGGLGIECSFKLSKKLREVHNGLQMVRNALQPASGPPRLFYVPSPANRTFVKAMQSYCNRKVNSIWIDEPQDPQEYEHIPDALRYYFVNRSVSQGIVARRIGAG